MNSLALLVFIVGFICYAAIMILTYMEADKLPEDEESSIDG